MTKLHLGRLVAHAATVKEPTVHDVPFVASTFELQQISPIGLQMSIESERIIACGFRGHAIRVSPAPPFPERL